MDAFLKARILAFVVLHGGRKKNGEPCEKHRPCISDIYPSICRRRETKPGHWGGKRHPGPQEYNLFPNEAPLNDLRPLRSHDGTPSVGMPRISWIPTIGRRWRRASEANVETASPTNVAMRILYKLLLAHGKTITPPSEQRQQIMLANVPYP